MNTNNPASPLAGLRGLVLDTETTGLDARTARIVQIAAIAVDGEVVGAAPVLSSLVDPGEPIPVSATAVHGISDGSVAAAPAFRELAARLAEAVAGRILIGHNIGFDLAVLAREHKLSGLDWQPPQALDVRMLARVALPTLASHTLDALASVLGVGIDGRHSAEGDARATAEIYVRLVPVLRKAGIRSLAEAEAACARLSDEEMRHLHAGWSQPRATDGRRLALERIDSYPYRHRVRDVMASPAVVLPGEADTREALRALIDKGISSVLVRRSDGVFGIVTERDVLRALARAGATGTTEPLAALMRHPLTTVGQDDFVYRAIARMDRLGIRHLPVDDGYGRIVGMVTPRNLLRQRAGAAFALGDVMDSASDVTELGNAWSRLPATAESLMAEEVDPRDVAAVISSELGALTARAARMAEQRLAAAGQGEPPCRYAVLVLGSGGRGESLLAADQDNAVVYEHGEPDGPEDRYFAALGGHMADILDQVGVPYCKGGVMARNAAWRHDVAGWKALAASWIRGSKPEDLLNIDIFFDAQCVHGDAALADSVLAHARAIARSAPLFLKLMTDLARDWQAPFGLFGGIRTDEKGRVDLKKGGIMPIFTGARVLAIKHGVAERATPARLAAVRDLGIGEASEMTAVIEAHRKLLGFILEQQLADIRAGIPASNRVELARLSKIRQAELKAALKQVGVLTGILGEGRL